MGTWPRGLRSSGNKGLELEPKIRGKVEPEQEPKINNFGSATLFIAAGFRSRPVLGRLRLREFFIRSRLRLLVKENIILEFFKTDYELSKIRSNTCTSTCRSYFMFTLEKTSNDVKFHVIFVNY